MGYAPCACPVFIFTFAALLKLMHRFSLLALLLVMCAMPVMAQRGTLSPSAQAFAQQAQVLREIQYTLQSLTSRVEAMEQHNATLASRLAALERGAGVASKDDLAAVRTDLAAVRSAQERLRGEIIEELSGKIAAISQREAQARAAAEAKAREAAQKSGYNHTVEAGQTLSAIAEAYKVSVRTIMRANKLSDPSKLRIGQKLFIPDP